MHVDYGYFLALIFYLLGVCNMHVASKLIEYRHGNYLGAFARSVVYVFWPIFVFLSLVSTKINGDDRG